MKKKIIQEKDLSELVGNVAAFIRSLKKSDAKDAIIFKSMIEAYLITMIEKAFPVANKTKNK